MKLTFEGPNFHSILVQIRGLLEATKNISDDVSENAKSRALPSSTAGEPQGPGPDPVGATGKTGSPPVEKPAEKSVEKPADKPQMNPQIAKMQAAKAAKQAERAAAKAKSVDKPDEGDDEEDIFRKAPVDPAEMVKIRQKTIEDLQQAYANGHQKEVFELLSRFGNGAKSFRELPPEAFAPIREAIDNGALT